MHEVAPFSQILSEFADTDGPIVTLRVYTLGDAFKWLYIAMSTTLPPHHMINMLG